MNKISRKVTVYDIARVARVSVGSVSRALNNLPDVTADIRDRIHETARSLGYSRLRKRTHRAGAGRHGQLTHSIGMICFGMDDALVNLPVVSTAMHAIERTIGESGGSLMFASIPKGDRAPAFLSDGLIAGIILKGPNQGELPSDEASDLLRLINRVPHVWMMGRLPNAQGDHCNFDADSVGRIAAQHLHDMGHRRIGFLNPKPGHAQFEVIKQGFAAHAQANDSQVEVFEPKDRGPIAWPLPATTSQQKVDELVEQWCGRARSRRPTALAVGADSTAVQVYSALNRLGIQPGKDVGLISCNNEQSLIAGLHPALTTVDVRAETIGRNALARLLWRIANPADKDPVRLLVQPVLVPGKSVPKL